MGKRDRAHQNQIRCQTRPQPSPLITPWLVRCHLATSEWTQGRASAPLPLPALCFPGAERRAPSPPLQPIVPLHSPASGLPQG